jgi:hypothetical protein
MPFDWLLLCCVAPAVLDAAGPPSAGRYHLTARAWAPSGLAAEALLDKVEGLARFTAGCQNTEGAVIDPFLHREHQYATPYYAQTLGTLLAAGRCPDLKASGLAAMDWATSCFEHNRCSGHRVFYLTPLVECLDLYGPLTDAATLARWRQRLAAPVGDNEAGDNNWTTYLMKGEWLRAQAGLVDRAAATARLERLWRGSQRAHIAPTLGSLYHDLSSDPDTLAVEAVGRVNLLALAESGYDGPSAAEIRRAAVEGTRTSLLLMDPSGQMPCNGRTDDHVWGDVGYLLACELLANRAAADGQAELAGQCRRAAALTFANLERWRRADGKWAGSYYVTKNHFDPALRVGYQGASEYSNYNGSLMHHLAQAFSLQRAAIAERPAPVEVGGYAFALDDRFAAAFANAGGLQVQIDLRADTQLSSQNPDYWCALGVVRLGRAGWDTRLGPSDGGRNGGSGLGASFAPTFWADGHWQRLASLPQRYEGHFSVQSVHPLLVRCAVDWRPRGRQAGPSFRQELTLTPDGLLCTARRTAGDAPWGLTLPLLTDDGRPLVTSVADRLATTRYADGGDEQAFIAVDPAAALVADEPTVRSTYGDLRPVRLAAVGETAAVFVYPRSPGDPSAAAVRDGLRLTPTGFTSPLGTVDGDLCYGRGAAGGHGQRVALAGGDVSFSQPCGFIVQHAGGRPTAVEADREVEVTAGGRPLTLRAYVPQTLENLP